MHTNLACAMLVPLFVDKSLIKTFSTLGSTVHKYRDATFTELGSFIFRLRRCKQGNARVSWLHLGCILGDSQFKNSCSTQKCRGAQYDRWRD